MLIEDDALKPANAKQIADKMVQDGVRLFTGINFSNVLVAVAPTVLESRRNLRQPERRTVDVRGQELPSRLLLGRVPERLVQ